MSDPDPSSPASQQSLPVASYVCRRAPRPIAIDGVIDPAWDAADWTEDFVDIQGAPMPKPPYRTRAKMLWDDGFLYILAELEEPHVWGTLTQRNSIVFQDNDFEVFIDPDGDRLNYYEFEVNALNAIMELVLDKPYIDGGNYRFVELAAVRSAVSVRGTLNDPRDLDSGWIVEIAIPFAGLQEVAGGVNGPPRPGDVWRMNFSRVQWAHTIEQVGERAVYRKVPKEQRNEDNWVWSPMGVIDMHRPERWGHVTFEK